MTENEKQDDNSDLEIKLAAAVASLALEVQKRKRAEEALRECEEHWKLALEQSEARERETAQELELTLKQLKSTQAQLAEKTSSLESFFAGFANQINHPVNMIKGNLIYANQSFQQLVELIELYQQTYPNSTSEIQQLAQTIDFDFLVEDLPKLISSMQMGVERTFHIVQSLRNLSRLDE